MRWWITTRSNSTLCMPYSAVGGWLLLSPTTVRMWSRQPMWWKRGCRRSTGSTRRSILWATKRHAAAPTKTWTNVGPDAMSVFVDAPSFPNARPHGAHRQRGGASIGGQGRTSQPSALKAAVIADETMAAGLRQEVHGHSCAAGDDRYAGESGRPRPNPPARSG